MTHGLNVLVLESDAGAATVARQVLTEAGHTLFFCHDPGQGCFPCNALHEGRGCPLEGRPIDVALDVRARARSAPTVREDGVACAIREQVPLVVAGPTVFSPYEEYATEMREGTFDVVAACERAAAAPLRRHTEVAQEALETTLERRSMSVGARATVYRRDGALLVSVTADQPVDTATKSMVAVRVNAALRSIDRYARGIDVVFN